MESFELPLRVLAEEAGWFARDREVRLLHVVTTADFRDAVLKVLMGQEFHADNRAPFVRFDDGFSAESPGWTERAQRLRDQHEARVAQMAEATAKATAKATARELSPAQVKPKSTLPPRPPMRDALAGFAAQVRQVVTASPPPLDGLVVVLAPTRIDDAVQWTAAVSGLVSADALADVRWIVVDLGAPTIVDLTRALGRRAMTVTAVVDDAAADRDMAEMLDRAAEASPGAPGPALIGAAWPRGISPPLRPGQTVVPDAEIKASMIAAGVTPALSPGEGQRLRTLVLRAVQALKAGRGADAVRLQREARDFCDEIGLPREAVLMELILGAYLVQLGQRPLAFQTYDSAGRRAEDAGMLKESAQAQLAIGALHGIEKRPDQASLAYARAGDLAHRAGVPILAIEAYRLSGQHCSDLRVKVKAWNLALEVAGEIKGNELKASSAAETARALAALLRKSGLFPQAADMERQSVAFEAGETAAEPRSTPAASPALGAV